MSFTKSYVRTQLNGTKCLITITLKMFFLFSLCVHGYTEITYSHMPQLIFGFCIFTKNYRMPVPSSSVQSWRASAYKWALPLLQVQKHCSNLQVENLSWNPNSTTTWMHRGTQSEQMLLTADLQWYFFVFTVSCFFQNIYLLHSSNFC